MSGSRYAEDTRVPVTQSVEEIKRTVKKYGATDFAYVESQKKAGVAFVVNKHSVKLEVQYPDKTSQKRRDQKIRQKWRVLLLLVKGTFEAIENDLMSFEQAFMSSIVLENGQTLGERFLPELEAVISTGKIPLMLGDGRK